MSTSLPHPWPPPSLPPKLSGCFTIGTYAFQQQYLPLLDSEAHTTIFSTAFKTVLKQTYLKTSFTKHDAECMYQFPLYDGVSVVEFKCRIGTKPALCCLVKEKGDVHAKLDATMDEHNAGLLIQVPQSSDVFTTRIGSAPVGESIFIEITYIGELERHDDMGIRFTIPSTIASPLHTVPRASVLIRPSAWQRITVDIILPVGEHIKGVESPSHLIAVSAGTISVAPQAVPVMNKASATFSLETAILEKDFILIIQLKHPSMSKALLETHPTISNHRALMVTLAAPSFSMSSSLPTEIILVADRSASMRHDIPMLISTLKVFLMSLPTCVRFNICSFGTEHTFLWSQSKIYTDSSLREAIQHISTFEANYGGTEIFKPIEATIDRRLPDLPLDIILFTDGNILDQGSPLGYINEQVEMARITTSQEALFTSIHGKVEKTKQQGIRIFSIGIGNKFSHALVEGIAKAGEGLCIALQDGERLEKSTTRMLREVLSPHYEDSVLEVNYAQNDDDFELVEVTEIMEKLSSSEIEDITASSSGPRSDLKDKRRDTYHIPQIIQAPRKIPSLLAAAKPTVYILMGPETIRRNPTSIVLRSPYSHGPPALEIPIEVLSARGTTIHQLAARKAAQDLKESRGWIFDESHNIAGAQNMAKREAVRLGETFQVLNKWCSFVTVTSSDGKEAFTRNLTLQSDVQTNNPYGLPVRPRRILTPRAENTSPKPPQPPQLVRVEENSSPLEGESPAETFRRLRRTSRVNVAGVSIRRRRQGATEIRTANVSKALVNTTTASPTFPSPNLTKGLALIELQRFDGAWSTGSEKLLLDIMGFEVPKPPLDGASDMAWVTMLVVRFLEERMPKEEDVWSMVVEKARQYVRKSLETRGDLHVLEELAGEVVSKGETED